MTRSTCLYLELPLTDYREAWELQRKIVTAKISRSLSRDVILVLEHPPVYTLGRRGGIENLCVSKAFLERKGIAVVPVERGGDITYHGPGQIVGYPIIDLESFKPDIRWYMRSLEEVIIRTLADYGLKGERSEGETGVWLDTGTPFARKICALGVRTSRWVTMHGFALNVNTDLGYFDHIIPCGIRGKAVSSMHSELNRKLDPEEVKAHILRHFAAVFETEMTPLG